MKAISRLFCALLACLCLFSLLPLSAQENESPSVSVGGVPLAYFRIVYRDKENLPYAQQLQRILTESFGKKVPIKQLRGSETGKNFFVIGSTHLRTWDEAEFYAYTVEAEGNRLFFNAYDQYAYDNAFLAVAKRLKRAGENAETADLACRYTLPDRETYLKNPDLLYMRWAAEWSTPGWMLDYTEKADALFGGKGTEKVWVNAHRADHTYYPENSLEAIISCYYMGVAVVELDLSITKDGVIVLMHDDTLTRMTNVNEYMGTPGYPTTARVSDWTYSQLQDLRLKERQGGASAALTEFRIATLEEALTVCRDRMFIVPDKPSYWQYIDTVDVMSDSAENFLFPLMEKTGNYESVIISYGKPGNSFLTPDQAMEIQDAVRDACRITPYIMVRCSLGDTETVYADLECGAPGTFAIQLGGDYAPRLDYSDGTGPYLTECTFAAWTIGTGASYNDHADNWKTLANQGVRLLMTNDPMGMVKFAAEYHTP